MNQMQFMPFVVKKIIGSQQKMPAGLRQMKAHHAREERRHSKRVVVSSLVLKVFDDSGTVNYEKLSSALCYALDWRRHDGQTVDIHFKCPGDGSCDMIIDCLNLIRRDAADDRSGFAPAPAKTFPLAFYQHKKLNNLNKL